MFKSITIFLFIILFTTSFLPAQSILGKWKTIDDETGKAKSIVEIYMRDGKAYGKIIKLFRKSSQEQNPICDKCTDYRKDKKIIGMTIISAMKKNGDEWEDGEILDPNNGKIYNCKLWIEDGKLQVRGYVAFFYRTQNWIKVN